MYAGLNHLAWHTFCIALFVPLCMDFRFFLNNILGIRVFNFINHTTTKTYELQHTYRQDIWY